MSEQENLNIVRKEYDSLNNHNLDASVQYYADSFKGMDVGYPKSLSKQDIRKDNQIIFSAFPNLKFDLKDLVAQGNIVAASWLATGVQKGDLTLPDGSTISATNQSIRLPGVTFYEFRDGMIVREDTYYDQVTLLTQLGVVTPQELVERIRH